jgi:hypothetical protein
VFGKRAIGLTAVDTVEVPQLLQRTLFGTVFLPKLKDTNVIYPFVTIENSVHLTEQTLQ